MPRIKNGLLACLILIVPSLFSHAAQALEYKNSFGSINAGYADWNSGFVNVHRGEVWKQRILVSMFEKPNFTHLLKVMC